jgi:hypothetical protein
MDFEGAKGVFVNAKNKKMENLRGNVSMDENHCEQVRKLGGLKKNGRMLRCGLRFLILI